MTYDQPGIYYDVPTNDYFADPCPEPSLTQSIVKVLTEQSAWHARLEHPRLAPPADEDGEETEKYVKALAIGNAAHKLLLGRGKDIEICPFDSFRKQDAKDQRDLATAAGRVPILEKHMVHASTMVEAAWLQMTYHEEKELFRAGRPEVMIIAKIDGIWCRSLVDWLSIDNARADDYKTTQASAAPHVMGMRADSGGWHIQAAFQERILNVIRPDLAGRWKFRFIAQEGYPPYALNVMPMDNHWLTIGRKIVDAGMERWRQALANRGHLGYPLKAVYPDFPKYSENRWLERELGGEFDPSVLMAG